MYARYQKQRQAKYAADRAARDQELAEIRGEQPAQKPAEPEQPQAAAPQPPQPQRNDQKRR